MLKRQSTANEQSKRFIAKHSFDETNKEDSVKYYHAGGTNAPLFCHYDAKKSREILGGKRPGIAEFQAPKPAIDRNIKEKSLWGAERVAALQHAGPLDDVQKFWHVSHAHHLEILRLFSLPLDEIDVGFPLPDECQC